MKVYKTKVKRLAGTEYAEVYPRAIVIYREIKHKTKRRPYVRAAYFNREKVFLNYFWEHLQQKNSRDRVRRLKFYPCAVDLIKNTKTEPASKENPNKKSEILHRFAGMTSDKELFFVQISEHKKTNQKFFLSVFPEK